MRKVKVQDFGTHCQGVRLYGNPLAPEPQDFAVQFPGGEVRVSRLLNGDYWCHVTAFKPEHFDGSDRQHGAMVDSRVDVLRKHASETIEGDFARPDTYHVAVRISTADGREK